MSINFYTNNVCLLGIKNIFKFQLHLKCIHRSAVARKITPQEVLFFIFRIPTILLH